MRITKNQLRQIIKEELAGVLGEADEQEEEVGNIKIDGKDTGVPGEVITAKPLPTKEKVVDSEQQKKDQATTRNLQKVTGKSPAKKKEKGKKK